MSKVFSFESLTKYMNKGFVREKHPTEDIYIYGYNSRFNIVWDDVNIHLRGLITNKDGVVMARSFTKFFNFKSYLSQTKFLLSDNQIVDIPDGKFKILEKIDGCLVMLYWINDQPYLATQRSFSSKKAIRATQILYSKYSSTFNKFDRDKTYIFEAIFPETRVIIDYGSVEELYLIGILDTETGNDCVLENIGFKLPHDYTDELNYVNDIRVLQNLNMYNKEGFVLVYENGYRLKVKFQWYRTMHSMFAKIIKLQQDLYIDTLRFKALMNIDKNLLSNHHIFQQLNNGLGLEKIMNNIPAVYYMNGIEHWVENVCVDYLNMQSDSNNNGEDINEITPNKIEYFDINNLDLFYTDSIMWNFMNRLKDSFD